jgi:hypothetical protein
MAERFDNYAKSTASAVPTVTSAMIDTVPCAMVEEIGSESEEEEEEEETDYVQVMANELRKEKEREKGKKKMEVIIPKAKPTVKIVEKPVDPKPAITSAVPYHKSEPQYRYESPAKSTELVARVWERSLDAPITVSQRELLAVSIDLRKKAKEFTSAKKVPRSKPSCIFSRTCSNLTPTARRSQQSPTPFGLSNASSPRTPRGYLRWKQF